MLAEGEKPELYEAFNATYAFAFKDTILDIARGKKTSTLCMNILKIRLKNLNQMI